MNKKLYANWYAAGLLSDDSFQKLNERDANPLISLHWEIKTLLYLGVLLLSGGLGIVIYKNIESIGHLAILAFLGILSMGCFYFCFTRASSFSRNKINANSALLDYTLLLACLTFISCIGYLQFHFNFFGSQYGLASFTTLSVLLFSAYYFDHLGILSLAITNLAAWLGISVTLLTLLKNNDFYDSHIIFISLFLGCLLLAGAYCTKRWNFKRHFEFTYFNFAIHILFVSCIAAMFYFDHYYLLWFLLLNAIACYCYVKARSDRSFYLVLIATLYAYFGLSYVVIALLIQMTIFDLLPIYLGLLYFIISGISLVLFLIRMNKKMKADDNI